jgi:hypothetical protein
MGMAGDAAMWPKVRRELRSMRDGDGETVALKLG